MPNPIWIEKINLQGFRAYLQPQGFKLKNRQGPVSIAIFAPNAKGKSSLVDAVEFFFSEHGTLERLGRREAQTHAGPAALAHVDAEEAGIAPAVHLWFARGSEHFDESRAASHQQSSLPSAAYRVLQSIKVPFVIRGHDLRHFAEKLTPEQRYEEAAEWLGLAPLVEIQKNLRQLRRKLKEQVDSDDHQSRCLRDLSGVTNGACTSWDDEAICDWANENLIRPLSASIAFETFGVSDPAYGALKASKDEEDQRLGVGHLRLVQSHTDALFAELDGDDPEVVGAVVNFEGAIAAAIECRLREQEERASAGEVVFSDVWTAAKSLLEEESLVLEECPVCETPFNETPAGSRTGVAAHLAVHLSKLEAYRSASSALARAKEDLSDTQRALLAAFDSLAQALEGADQLPEHTQTREFRRVIESWREGDHVPDSDNVVAEITRIRAAATAQIAQIEKHGSGNPYGVALATVDRLLAIRFDLDGGTKIKAELTELQHQLNHQARLINQRITGRTQRLIEKLRLRVNELFLAIQADSTSATPVRLDLPPEDDTNQQRLHLRFDFAENRQGAVPSGYLSDSQLHSLALSLRLAAIELFNKDFPVVVLDDVVSSYDADHRKTLAAVLAMHFSKHQLILATLDEMFFRVLQDHLPPSSWRFERITQIAPEFGPKFQGHRTPDQVIEAALTSGESVANEIRQAEADWLLSICRDLRTDVAMRPVSKPYEFSRFELAVSLAAFLKVNSLAPPRVPGISNPFLVSLQRGDIENFGSRFSDNPNQSTSRGDEAQRWREFVFFREQFKCPNCEKKRFARPDPMRIPLCRSCSTPFSFSDPADA